MQNETILKKAWLNYFNRTLRDAELISEQEYRKIKNQITVKYTSPSLMKISQRGGPL